MCYCTYTCQSGDWEQFSSLYLPWAFIRASSPDQNPWQIFAFLDKNVELHTTKTELFMVLFLTQAFWQVYFWMFAHINNTTMAEVGEALGAKLNFALEKYDNGLWTRRAILRAGLFVGLFEEKKDFSRSVLIPSLSKNSPEHPVIHVQFLGSLLLVHLSYDGLHIV